MTPAAAAAHHVNVLGFMLAVLPLDLQPTTRRAENTQDAPAGSELQPWSAGELIEQLDDTGGEICHHAADALERLTGETMGRPPERRRTSGSSHSEWRRWWGENNERLAGAP